QIISRLNRLFEIELPLRNLFEFPTIAGLAAIIERTLRTGEDREQYPAPRIVSVSRDRALPLSFAQQRLWFLDQLVPGNPFYNIAGAVNIKGKLDILALEWSINEIIRRHEILRTNFTTVEGQAIQVIAAQRYLPLPIIDLKQLSFTQRAVEIGSLIDQESHYSFQLAQGPLLRSCLLRLDEQEHILLLVTHHIISDGWSIGIFLRELTALYQAFSEGRVSPLPELTIQYADFAYWQREWLKGEVLESQLSYWRRQLADISSFQLPTDRPRPPVQTFNGAYLIFTLPTNLSEELKWLSQKRGATLFMTLMAAFQVMLYRYSDQQDIIVGTDVASRNRIEIEGLIGFFINQLAIRISLSGNLRFVELLAQVRRAALEAYAFQDLPFDRLVEAINPPRDLSRTPVFQIKFIFQNVPITTLQLTDSVLRSVEINARTARFDLTLVAMEKEQGLAFCIEYNTDLFDEVTIKRMAGHFHTLLASIVAGSEQQLWSLQMLSEAERHQLLAEWNNTAVDYPQDKCIHQLFEEQVERTPNAIALVYEQERLTYQQLNRHANQLAHYLRALGVGPEVLIGICLDRSIEMVVTILGVLKAGGAYLPINPDYPVERTAFMLEDSQASVLLTTAELADELPVYWGQVICIDMQWQEITQQCDSNANNDVVAGNLAYVIYTSGSTGKPKGVAIEHRGLSNLAQTQREAFDVKVGSRVLQFAPLSFDASVAEVFTGLIAGATLWIAKQEELLPGADLIELMAKSAITMVTLPPSVLSTLSVIANAELPELATLVSAGEACSAEIVARWAKGRRFFNAYGPTEATVCASIGECDSREQRVTIGRAISNVQVYILDEWMQVQPIGVAGELCISGRGVARGYLNRPELTAEKFVPNPFSEEAGTRLYRTGDLARYLADGDIEYLG
ncbi:MAG: amino acid adenylation domain-containing protein, partial [Acidobacteriota bacterium]